ncbi:MAG TPA: hypothetical protein VGV35_05810 [Bryobacteraceae bacterium]|nr:hypothetical protein [Bryobacteraceae bacterium]
MPSVAAVSGAVKVESSYLLIVIPVSLALIVAALRRTHGSRYWMAAFFVIVLSVGLLYAHDKTAGVVAYALPMSAAFLVANARTFRARLWLIVIVVPFVYWATIMAVLLIGVALGLIQE